MITRRDFLKFSAATGAAFWASRYKFFNAYASVQIPQTPIPGNTIPRFVEALPVFGPSQGVEPGEVNAPRVTGTNLTVTMNEIQQKVLPASFYAGLPAPYNAGAYVWGYNVGNTIPIYPGITVEAQRGVPTQVTYINSLPINAILLAQITTDQSLEWADPDDAPMMIDQDGEMIGNPEPYLADPPVVAHLHGGEVPSMFDGGPDAWFTPSGKQGPAFHSLLKGKKNQNAARYLYNNEQEAATLWFHDHTMGATRLNVYRGLAAFYLLRDQFDTGLPDNPLRLPAGQFEREIAIQDRQFDTNGQLFWPDSEESAGLNGPPPNPLLHPYWNPEFFGDVMVVNGKSWPYFNVQPRRYRFRLLDGCNARFLELRLMNRSTGHSGPAFWVIGDDGGLLDLPVKLNDPAAGGDAPRLLMAPGERYDIIIDFSGFAGQTLTLINSAKAPYPNGTAPDPQTTGQVMQFRVTLPLSGQDMSYNPATDGALRQAGSMPPIIRLADPATGALAAGVSADARRLLTLVEIEGEGGPEEVLVNNSGMNGKRLDGTVIPGAQQDDHGNYLTELPRVGATEVWEIVNTTADAHPMHLHLTQFQLINRQNFNLTQYRALYDSLFPGGLFVRRHGPPLPIDGSDPLSAGKLGGNPDVTPFLQGNRMPPLPQEAGWKDTVKMFPGQVSRIAVRFAPQDTALGDAAPGVNKYGFDPTVGPGYVWHCHIVDHEDNEMMRPYIPTP